MKKSTKIAGGILVVLVLVFVALELALNPIVKKGVNAAAPAAMVPEYPRRKGPTMIEWNIYAIARALHVLGARRDCLSEDDLRAWRRETCGTFTLEWLDGDHAYLRPQEEELLSLIEFHASRLLRREAAGVPLGA